MKKHKNIVTTITSLVGISCAAVVFMLLIAPHFAKASFSQENWQYYRDIQSPSIGSGFTKIVLPDNIAHNENFSDVRITTTGGTEIPYVLTRNSVVRGGEVNGRIIDKTDINGNEVFVVDTGVNGNIHTGLSLSASALNYRRQVTIYSSGTLAPISDGRWTSVTSNGYIFRFTDPSTGYSSGKNNIDFPANTSRYLKVIIGVGDSAGNGSSNSGIIGVNSVNVYGDRTIDVPAYSETKTVSIFNNTEKRTTEVTLDMGASGHLTSAITLYPTDKNYSRRVVIETTDDPLKPNNWQYIGQASISRVTTSLFDGASNRITYGEQKTRYIRLSIVNDDNRPLTLGTDALVEGPIISLIFEVRSGEAYRLYYGNPEAILPTYDLSSISGYIQENTLPQSYLGAENANTLFVAPAPRAVPFAEAYPWVLNVVLVIVVLIIAAGIAWYIHAYMKKHE